MPGRLVAAMFAAALVALICALRNVWWGFGAATFALLILGLALGLGRLAPSLLLLFAAYALLLAGMGWLRDSRGLILGFPLPTALLVYGIWPLPLAAGLLYGLVFRSSVLPEVKLERFLREYRVGRPPGRAGR
jgi:hypothetical protein